MKILSLNLHCFKEENRIEKLDKICKFIIKNNIDICVFQEVAQEKDQQLITDTIRIGNNADYIAKKIGYNIYFHPIKIAFEILEEGLAFVSKYPISNPEYKTISKTTNFLWWNKRDYLSVEIKNTTFFNVHLGWDAGEEVGLNQIKNLLSATKNHNKHLFFLCGDFNYNDYSDEIKYIKNHYYSIADLAQINSFENPTFIYDLDNTNSKNDNKMIDFIFTNQKIEIKKFEIVFKDDYVSDHCGLYLEY